MVDSVSVDDAGIYQMVVDQRGQETRSGFIEVVVLIPPSISSQPIDQELLAGEKLELRIDAEGTQPMTYQLLREGDVIQGNQTGVFVIENVNAALSGNFSIAASNEAGTKETNPFILTISTAPPAILSQSSDILAVPGNRVELFVNATGGGTTYRWFKDGVLLGGETQSTLIIDSVTSESAGVYFVVVNNARGVITSAPMSITLSAVNTSVELPELVLSPRISISISSGMLSIEVVGGSGGEVWRVERSSDLLTWESLGTVEPEANGGLGTGVLSDVPLEDGSSFFRAVR